MNQDHSPPPPSQLSKAKIPLQTGAAKSTGLLLPVAFTCRSFFQGEAVCHHFSSCPQLPIPEAKFQVGIIMSWRLPSSTQFLLMERRLYFEFSVTENTEALPSLFGPVKWWFHDKGGELRGCQTNCPSTSQHSTTNARVSFRENCAAVSTPRSRALAQSICLGEK